MTQITLNITNPSSARAIRALVRAMDGVSIAKKSETVRRNRIDMALEEARKGNVTSWESVDDLAKHIESL